MLRVFHHSVDFIHLLIGDKWPFPRKKGGAAIKKTSCRIQAAHAIDFSFQTSSRNPISPYSAASSIFCIHKGDDGAHGR